MAAKRKTPFTKVILNVPTSLLEKFDFAAKTNDYSRSEAVKEAIQDELKDILLEAVKAPKTIVNESVIPPVNISNKSTGPNVDVKTKYICRPNNLFFI